MGSPSFDQFMESFQHKPHHAWLLKGSNKKKKKAFIARICLSLLPDLQMPHDESEGWYSIMHPGFLYIHPEDKPSISVDQVRKIQHHARQTSATGDWKICVIDALNHLTIQGQNALLKILEAPPAKNLFLILHHPGHALLPTISSRTASLNFTQGHKTSVQEKAMTILMALEDNDGDSQHTLGHIHELVSKLVKNEDKVHEVLVFNKKYSGFTNAFLDLLQLWNKTSVRYVALQESEELSPLSSLPLEKLLEFDQYMGRLTHEYTQLGLDHKQVIFTVCQKLRRLASV